MAHPQAHDSIPTYLLYGERFVERPAGFVHIETIAARSALHGWEIAPHRHESNVQLLLVQDGAVALTIDGALERLAGPCHVMIPAGAVHGFRFAPETRGHVLTISQDVAARAGDAAPGLYALLSAGARGRLSAEEARRTVSLADELLRLVEAPLAPTPLLGALAEALLHSLPVEAPADSQGDDRRLAVFRHLIETHLREHRPVRFYANSMGMTQRTLTRLCRRRLGCTPLEAINRRSILEARRLLRYTTMPVHHVAAELGFLDPSYFSRFYMRMTGRRPQAERLCGGGA